MREIITDTSLEESISTDGSDSVGAGLVNWINYNICYMNSALQILFCTVPLVTKLKDVTCQKHPSGGDSGFCGLKALKKLFRLCMRSRRAVVPVEFIWNLTSISSHFQLGYHEDSHEFLLNLLEHIKKNCNDGENTDMQSLVEEVFGIRSILLDLCCNCCFLSATSDPMFFLTLPVSGVSTLTDALMSYIKFEKREGVKCDHCNGFKRIAWTMIEHAPKVVSFQFNRYNNSMEKDYTAMKYPLELDLSPFIHAPKSDEQYEYELYAVIDHVGSTTYGGHYLSYVRSSATTWHEKNDDLVCEVSEAEVLNRMPYMLFYVKKGTPWFSSLDMSEFICSPKSVLSPDSSSVDGEIPEKVTAIHQKEIHESPDHSQLIYHESEMHNFHEETPSTYHSYNFQNCTSLNDHPSTSQIQSNAPKRPNCYSNYASSASHIRPLAAKKQKGSSHVIDMEHAPSYENLEEDKENRQAAKGKRGHNNNKGSQRILKPTRNASNINPSIKSVLKGRRRSRQMQFLACLPQKSFENKKPPCSSMPAPASKKRRASALETDPKFDVFSFRCDSPKMQSRIRSPFSSKCAGSLSARKLF